VISPFNHTLSEHVKYEKLIITYTALLQSCQRQTHFAYSHGKMNWIGVSLWSGDGGEKGFFLSSCPSIYPFVHSQVKDERRKGICCVLTTIISAQTECLYNNTTKNVKYLSKTLIDSKYHNPLFNQTN
jgi:hypothetical protein